MRVSNRIMPTSDVRTWGRLAGRLAACPAGCSVGRPARRQSSPWPPGYPAPSTASRGKMFPPLLFPRSDKVGLINKETITFQALQNSFFIKTIKKPGQVRAGVEYPSSTASRRPSRCRSPATECPREAHRTPELYLLDTNMYIYIWYMCTLCILYLLDDSQIFDSYIYIYMYFASSPSNIASSA